MKSNLMIGLLIIASQASYAVTLDGQPQQQDASPQTQQVPQAVEPAPTAVQPVPQGVQPAPITPVTPESTQAPTPIQPAPTAPQPAIMQSAPAPTSDQPAPAYIDPRALTAPSQAPTTIEPGPVIPAPQQQPESSPVPLQDSSLYQSQSISQESGYGAFTKLDGRWKHGESNTTIKLSGGRYVFCNEDKDCAQGYFTIEVPKWGVTGHLSKDGRTIFWSNGTSWHRR